MRTILIGGALTAIVGCSGGGSGTDLPLISPPVRAATPAGLQITARRAAPAVDATLSATELKNRFFSGSGPTDLMTLLAAIDQRLDEVNSASNHPACLDQAPVSYTITPAGQSIEMVAQCYRRFSGASAGDPAFLQFGVRDGVTSLYVAVGAERLAAVVSPIAGAGSGSGSAAAGASHVVDAWFGVGYTNATGCGSTGTFDDCSYGLTGLHADPGSQSFEMTVAGIGVGYCGIQFASDGTVLQGIGSTDMGATCNAPATLCVSATDLGTAATCPSATYQLPAIGRRAGEGAHVFGASQYPDTPNITLDGTATDSLYFAPVAPTDGVGNFDGG